MAIHTFTSDEALTLDGLLRMVDLLPKVPRVRIIVGMPGLPNDQAFKRQSAEESLLLIGRAAYEAFRRSLPPPQTVVDPREVYAVRFCGVPIEFFGDRTDHATILRDIAELLARNALLRVSLDEEFGDTNPRIG